MIETLIPYQYLGGIPLDTVGLFLWYGLGLFSTVLGGLICALSKPASKVSCPLVLGVLCVGWIALATYLMYLYMEGL